jgi:acyl carrier protein
MALITSDDVLDVIADEAPVERDKLDPAATLESLGVASLDVISVLFTLEDRFGVVVQTEDVEGVETLQQFIDVVLAKAGETQAV